MENLFHQITQNCFKRMLVRQHKLMILHRQGTKVVLKIRNIFGEFLKVDFKQGL